MPDRLPVDARGLHRNMRHVIHLEPVGELEERPCRRTEATDFAMLRLAHASYAGDDDVFVHVEARTARVQYFHFASSQRAGRSPRFRNLLVVLRDLAILDTVRGARRAPGPTTERARGTTDETTSFPTTGK